MVLALLFVALLAPTLVGAQTDQGRSISLPAWALSVEADDPYVIVSLGLGGVAFVDSRSPMMEPISAIREEWPTLRAIKIEDGGALLLGRDSIIRYVRYGLDELGEFETHLVTSWEVEGMPTGVAMSGTKLVFACGGAGASVWVWPDHSKPARMTARYPFMSYAKQVVLLEDDIFLLADTHDALIILVDIKDPLRPKTLGSVPIQGFLDDLAVSLPNIWVVDRIHGTALLNWDSQSGTLSKAEHIPLIDMVDMECLSQTVTAGDGWALICEGNAGVRLIAVENGTWTEIEHIDTPGKATKAIPTKGGRLAISDTQGGVFLTPTEHGRIYFSAPSGSVTPNSDKSP